MMHDCKSRNYKGQKKNILEFFVSNKDDHRFRKRTCKNEINEFLLCGFSGKCEKDCFAKSLFKKHNVKIEERKRRKEKKKQTTRRMENYMNEVENNIQANWLEKIC